MMLIVATAMISNKSQIRQLMREQLSQLSDQDILLSAKQVLQNIHRLPINFKNKKIGVYASIKNEINTDLIVEYLLSEKTKIFFPKIDQNQIHFYQVQSKKELIMNGLGIGEPVDTDPLLLADSLDYCFIPGLAFDQQGHRLGRGLGYYDRYLENTLCVKLGLAYDFQIVESIPVDYHDVHMDWVISEQRILDCRLS